MDPIRRVVAPEVIRVCLFGPCLLLRRAGEHVNDPNQQLAAAERIEPPSAA